MIDDRGPAAMRHRFSDYYLLSRAPWDIGRPQAAFVAAAGSIGHRVLDAGCGCGDLALWLAGRGHAVTAIDFLEEPLAVARRKAAGLGLSINFLGMDAIAIGTLPERFDAVTDSGMFHSFDDQTRTAYVGALTRLLEPGARVFLLCMSDDEPGTHGPRRVSAEEIRATFGDGWVIESIEPARFEVVPGIPGLEFGPGGARALFATIRRGAA
jgi:2-polyprenyl-3-methyl-5-hydroxy-6-metoxy-1,4-benzoquinol methylase